MDGIDRIISRIEADARHERERIAQDAELNEREIREQYRQPEQEAYGLTLKAGMEAAHAYYEALIRDAKALAEQRVDDERRALLDETFALAAELMRDEHGGSADPAPRLNDARERLTEEVSAVLFNQ